jgi:hypothetical protein
MATAVRREVALSVTLPTAEALATPSSRPVVIFNLPYRSHALVVQIPFLLAWDFMLFCFFAPGVR